MLVIVGVLQVSGAWTAALTWLKVYWINSYEPPSGTCHHCPFGKIKSSSCRMGRDPRTRYGSTAQPQRALAHRLHRRS